MKMQLAMLERALAPWPRRQAPLLEVNCGNGAFLEFFWNAGFDVQATETDPALRLKAEKRPVPGLEVFSAPDGDLPFDNDSFDWVVIHVKNPAREAIANCAREGARLARRGLMLTFWNSASLPAIWWRLAHTKPWAVNAAPWWRVWRQLSRLSMGRLATISTLAAPVCAWRRQWRFGGCLRGFPLGAWCAIRLDMGPAQTVTPLPLRLEVSMPQAGPLMEYAPKRSSTSSQKMDKS